MKIVFLDIDGVLNSEPWLRKDGNGKNFPFGHLDPTAISLLGDIVGTTESQIVISSSWRKLFRWQDLAKLLEERGFKYPESIIGQTIRMSQRGWQRGYEIDDWVRANHPHKYIILDDDSDMLDFQKSHFIHTSFKTGLTAEHAHEAILKLAS